MTSHATALRRVGVALAGSAIIAAHYLIFRQLLPNRNGRLGWDYGFFLPHLLDGFFWYWRNGLFAVPWFTPAFCGGMPKFPNPQSLYYSVPQLLVFVTDPLTSLRLTFLGFAAAGFWGFYLLLRGVFAATTATALLGGTLFLFNGLYAYRFLVGHLTFHAFMLIPLVCWLLLRPEALLDRAWRRGLDVACAGLLLGYIACTAIAHVLIQALVVVATMACALGVFYDETFRLRPFAAKLAAAGLLALGISAAPLVATLSFLGEFPRTLYPLAGVAHPWDLVALVAHALFWKPPEALARTAIVNGAWNLDRHELEFGITFVPLAILAMAVIAAATRWAVGSRGGPRDTGRRPWGYAGLAALLLAGPLALNYYSPAWHATLKRVPVLQNSVTLIRWLSVYIPSVILLAAIAIERTSWLRRWRWPIACAGIAMVIGINAYTERDFYHRQGYDPSTIVAAYRRVRAGEWTPTVTRIGVYQDQWGREALPYGRNDLIAAGTSQLLCYETLFGFRMERFPRKGLHAGAALEMGDGVLNLKNPACYVFPRENACAPGDHFRAEETSNARALLEYRPMVFAAPVRQRVANVVSVCTLSLTALWLALYVARRWHRRRGVLGL